MQAIRSTAWTTAAAALLIGTWGLFLPVRALDPSGAPAAPPDKHLSLDGIPLASPRAAAVREPSAPGAWGGPRTGKESTLSDRVVSYEIAATLDPAAHTVDATEKLTWRNRSKLPVRSVYLHLYLNAFEGENSTFFTESRYLHFGVRPEVPIHEGDWGHIDLASVAQGGAKVPWSFVHPDGGPETDHTVVRLDLPAAVAPGASTTLDIAFHDQLPRILARTGYFGTYHLVGQWFPKIAVLELPGERGAREVRWNAHEFHMNSEFYADYGNFDVRITVPKEYTVGAVGEEQGEPVVAGAMATHRFVQGDVHDFAWSADKRTAPPLEGEYRGEGSPVVKVKVLFPPEYANNAAPTLQTTIDSIGYFSRTLGPYPYRTVTVVIPPFNAEESGGMEYPTFFTSEAVHHPDPETFDHYWLDLVNIHEFGHGYFYGILGSNEFEEPMLDEGLNEYWDNRMLHERKEPAYIGQRLAVWLGLAFSVDDFRGESILAMRADPTDPLGANSWDRFSSQGYGTVYSRSVTVFHDLEEAVGKDATERAFREYYRLWKFRHPSIADLRQVLEQNTGQPALVDAVFEQQVYATGKLDDSVESLTSDEELPQPGTVRADGKWTERTDTEVNKEVEETRKAWEKAHPDAKEGAGPYPYRTTLTLRHHGISAPQDVVVRFVDGTSETFVWDSSDRWQRYTWLRPAQAVSAQIDPNDRHLLDRHVIDNSRTIKSDGSASRRWAADVAALIESLTALLGAL